MIDKKLYDSIARETELLKAYPNEYNANDPDNRDKLIRKNMRIPIDIAVRAALKYNIDGEDLDELIAQGFLGLATSYDKYDPTRIVHDKPAKFSSVAYMWSQAYILKEVKSIITRRNTSVDIDETIPDKDDDNVFWELMFDGVSETDLFIFEMKHGLAGEKPMTLKDISKKTGFTINLIKKAIERVSDAMKENAKKHNLVPQDYY